MFQLRKPIDGNEKYLLQEAEAEHNKEPLEKLSQNSIVPATASAVTEQPFSENEESHEDVLAIQTQDSLQKRSLQSPSSYSLKVTHRKDTFR